MIGYPDPSGRESDRVRLASSSARVSARTAKGLGVQWGCGSILRLFLDLRAGLVLILGWGAYNVGRAWGAGWIVGWRMNLWMFCCLVLHCVRYTKMNSISVSYLKQEIDIEVAVNKVNGDLQAFNFSTSL